jgi:hypothetical protein
VSCVDNHEARQAIHQVNGIILGGGNHHQDAQVCIGNTDDLDLMRRFIDGRDGKYPYLPKEGLLFPELLQPEPPEERSTPEPGVSCAELVASGDQHLLVNDMVATIMGQYLHRLLYRLPIHSFVTYAGMGDFISSRSLPVCREELEVFLGGA